MQLTKLLIALVAILVVASVATAKQANLRTQIAMRALETNAVSNASLITMGIIDGIAVRFALRSTNRRICTIRCDSVTPSARRNARKADFSRP